MKSKTMFFCTECGNETPKWAGRCSACGAWNSIVEQPEQKKSLKIGKKPLNKTSVKLENITDLHGEESYNNAVKISESLFNGDIKSFTSRDVEVAFKGLDVFTVKED